MCTSTLIARMRSRGQVSADPEAPVPTDVVKPGMAIDLRLVAENHRGVTGGATLRSLNPSLGGGCAWPRPMILVPSNCSASAGNRCEVGCCGAEIGGEGGGRHSVDNLGGHAGGATVVESGENDSRPSLRNTVYDGGGHCRCHMPGTRAGLSAARSIIPATLPQSETSAVWSVIACRRWETSGWHCRSFQRETRRIRMWNRLKDQPGIRAWSCAIYTICGAGGYFARSVESRVKGNHRTPSIGALA